MKRICALLFSMFFLFSVDSAMLVSAVAAEKQPNVVIILADDLGYGDVGCYGAKSVKTPNVDRLAAEGIRFTDAHAVAATCTPSRYALMTGQYPWRKPGTGILPGDAALIIPPGSTTLPSIMKQAGYTTGAVGKWHLGLGTPEQRADWNGKVAPGPLEIGFDYSFIIPATGDRTPCVYVENHGVVGLDPNDPITVSYKEQVGNDPTGREHPELLKQKFHHGHDMTIVNGISRIGYMSGGKSARWVDEDMADTITSKACQFIERNKEKPFFLYFATHDIHVPRVPHPRFVGNTPMGPRGDVIAEFDWSVGQVLETLDRLGLAENTIVILSSDNGPVLNDGYYDNAVEKVGDHRPTGPLRGGKGSAFEAGTRVPFLVRWPAKMKPGVSDALISLMDLPASMATFTQQKIEDGDFPDSENVLPALLGQSPVGRKFLVLAGSSMSLRHGTWKAILPNRGEAVAVNTQTETGNNPTPQVYQLDSDLGEQNNLADSETEVWNRMRAKLAEIRGSQTPPDRNFKPVVVEQPECRLAFAFENDSDRKITDSSGKGNHGTPQGATVKSGRFDGKSWIDMQKSASLAFARTPWTTEVEFEAKAPDGILVSVGAESQGYSVALEKGKLVFSATIDGDPWRVTSPEPIVGRCKAMAVFTSENKMVLYVDGKKVAENKMPYLVPSEPAVAWRIGAYSNSETDRTFNGVIFSVKLFAGEVVPQ